MKKLLVASSLGLAAIFGTASAPAALILAQTETDEWSVSRNLSLISGTTASGSVTSTALNGVVSVAPYSGIEDLLRVVIRVVQPDPDISPTISASIAIASGSDTFTSVTGNNIVRERTELSFGTALTNDLDTAGVTVSNPAFTPIKQSGSYANEQISVNNPITRSLDISEGPTVLFDSDNHTLTPSQLHDIFRDAGNLGFSFEVTSEFRWDRAGTEELTATLTGANSGQVIIEYYVIPEPSTALFAGLGLLGLLRRRR